MNFDTQDEIKLQSLLELKKEELKDLEDSDNRNSVFSDTKNDIFINAVILASENLILIYLIVTA